MHHNAFIWKLSRRLIYLHLLQVLNIFTVSCINYNGKVFFFNFCTNMSENDSSQFIWSLSSNVVFWLICKRKKKEVLHEFCIIILYAVSSFFQAKQMRVYRQWVLGRKCWLKQKWKHKVYCTCDLTLQAQSKIFDAFPTWKISTTNYSNSGSLILALSGQN